MIQKGLKIREEKFGANHRWTCESNYDLANAYVLDGQYLQAEKYYLKAIEIAKRINSQNDLAIAKTYLAKLYVDQNIKLNEAEELLLDALDYKLTIFGKENEGIAEIYNVLSKKAMLNNDNAYFKYLTNEALRSSRYIKGNIENTIAPEKALETMILKSTFNELNYKETNEVKFLEENYRLIDSELSLIKYMQKKVTPGLIDE